MAIVQKRFGVLQAQRVVAFELLDGGGRERQCFLMILLAFVVFDQRACGPPVLGGQALGGFQVGEFLFGVFSFLQEGIIITTSNAMAERYFIKFIVRELKVNNKGPVAHPDWDRQSALMQVTAR